MVSRSCSSCNKDLQKVEYSANQWKKGPSAKCKSCIANGGPPATTAKPTPKIDEPLPTSREEKTPAAVVVDDNKAEEEAAAKKKADELAAAEWVYYFCAYDDVHNMICIKYIR